MRRSHRSVPPRPARASLTLLGVIAGMLGSAELHAVPLTSLPDVSALAPYATFGKSYNDSNVTVKGDAAITANGSLSLAAPSKITGNLYLASGATKSGPGVLSGTLFTNQNLTTAQSELFSASLTLKGLTPNVSLGAVSVGSSGVTWGTTNGVADVNVFDVSSLTSGGGNINFVGDAGDYFVLNISGALSLTGSAAIGSLAQASHTFINLNDSSGTDLGVVAHIGNLMYGTTLIPYDAATFHSISGAIWSGNSTVTLMSGATVQSVPFSPPPPPPQSVPDETSTIALLAVGLASLAFARRVRPFLN